MKSRAQALATSGFYLGKPATKSVRWVALFALAALLGLSSTVLRAESAASYFRHGQSAEAREDYDAAFDNYQKAYVKAPKNLEYRTRYYRVRVTAGAAHMTKGHKLLDAGKDQEALSEFLRAAEIDPSNEAAQQAIAQVRKKNGETETKAETSLPDTKGNQEDLESMGAPAELKPVSNEPLTLHMSEDSKVVYQAIGKAAGVNILFDPDFTSKRIQADLNNVSLLDALRIVGTISNTFWRAVTDNTIFVAANTRAKRTELDEQAVETFYLSNAWQQTDLTDVGTAIRNVIPNSKEYPVPSQNAIVVRGTPDELLLAQKLVNDLDKARPEVVVDISILEVSKDWEKTVGIQWPSSASVSLTSASTSTTSSSSSSSSSGTSTTSTSGVTLYELAHLKANDFAVSIDKATASAMLSDSNTKILMNPRIRAIDGQKATFKNGEKIPIATGSYGGSGTGSSLGGVSSLVNTQFSYQDVGITVELTPTIHFNRDVTLKIKIEDTSQNGKVDMDGISEPIIAQKTIEQVIRLREGEAGILGGIKNSQELVSWSGIPGLSSIPGLKYLFGSKDRHITDDDLVFLVVPHVVRSQSLDGMNLRSIDTGVGTSIDIRHVPAEAPTAKPVANPATNPATAPAPANRPPANGRSSFGTVPGQSAAAAAPAALEQIRHMAETNGNPAPPAAPPVPASSMVNLLLTPLPGPVPSGATFKVPVQLNGGTDIASVPLQISYDPSKLALVNVEEGDFLGRDGKTMVLTHRDDGPGSIKINASRQGAPGVTGSGVVCILSFQAKAVGASDIVITQPRALTSAQKPVSAQGSQINVQVK
jgi:general secretion pathway protein D